MRKFWNALRRPSARWSVLALVAIGIVIGIALIVLPHVGIKVTSTTEFCVSCHSMQPVYEEYKQSVHFQTPLACELNAMTVISRRIFQAW